MPTGIQNRIVQILKVSNSSFGYNTLFDIHFRMNRDLHIFQNVDGGKLGPLSAPPNKHQCTAEKQHSQSSLLRGVAQKLKEQPLKPYRSPAVRIHNTRQLVEQCLIMYTLVIFVPLRKFYFDLHKSKTISIASNFFKNITTGTLAKRMTWQLPQRQPRWRGVDAA